jgi:hypothetical protein
VVEVSIRMYDEDELMARLAKLDRRAKTAFTASCAQRLLPLFDRYARSVRSPSMALRLQEIVSAAWEVASGAERDLHAFQAEAEGMVPSGEDGWTLETGYGQNAAAAAAYAIRTWLTDDPQEAAWAARQVYEVADYAALRSSENLDLNAGGAEQQVLESEIVQDALSALEHALSAAESAPTSWRALQARAMEDAITLARRVP